MNPELKHPAPRGSQSRTFIVDVEDRPGTLNRVVSLFRRRNYNIDSLSVGRTERPGISRITLVVRADEDIAHRIEANLYKLVNVLRVEDITQAPSVVRRLAFVKVNANDEERGEVLRVCELFRARVVDLHSASMTIEITGSQDKRGGGGGGGVGLCCFFSLFVSRWGV